MINYLSENEFICPICQEKARPIIVEHSPKKAKYIITSKCPRHEIKIDILEEEIKKYIYTLFQSTLICPQCGATYPDYQELDSYIIDGSLRTYLILEKYCSSCKKSSIFKLTNMLYTQFYNLNFDFLRSKETPELFEKYQKAILCPECKSNFIANNILLKMGKSFIEGFCSGSSHHNLVLKFPLEHQYIWLKLLLDTINSCRNCNSTDQTLDEIYFKYKKGFSANYLKKMVVIHVCNNCHYKNIIYLHHSLYETYSRILKEKKIFSSIKETLLCPKCSSETFLKYFLSRKNKNQALIQCRQKHRTKINLELNNKSIWIDSMLSIIKKCSNCWSSNLRVSQITPMILLDKIRMTLISLECLECKKKRKIVINNVILEELMDYLFQ